MKFIRDIIAEKRNASPAASTSSELGEVTFPVDPPDAAPEAAPTVLDETGLAIVSDAEAPEDEAAPLEASSFMHGQDEAPIHDQISGLLDSLNHNDSPEPSVENSECEALETTPETKMEAGFDDEADRASAHPSNEREVDPVQDEGRDTTEALGLSASADMSEAPRVEEDATAEGASTPGGMSPIGMLKRTPPPEVSQQQDRPEATRQRPAGMTRSTTRLHTPSEDLSAEVSAQPGDQVTPIAVPRPASGRSGGRSGRVKTRILGFSGADDQSQDPFSRTTQPLATAGRTFPVGWLIVIDGPGRGTAITLYDGVSQIGRGASQAVRLDFGDNSISRENHAAIAFDTEQNEFFIGHGGKANLVRLNNQPVLSTQKIASRDTIRIGETTLRFVGLCGPDFSWQEE